MLYILNTVVISQFSVQFLRGQTVILVNPGLGDKMVTNNTDNVLHSFSPTEEESTGRNNYPWSCDITGCLISNSDISGLCDIYMENTGCMILHSDIKGLYFDIRA